MDEEKNTNTETEKPQSQPTEPKKNSSAVLVIILIIVILLLLAAVVGGFFILKKAKKSVDQAIQTATVDIISGSTVTSTRPSSGTTATPSGSETAITDQEPSLTDLATKYFEWIVARQNAEEDYLATKSYMNLDYLSSDFRNSVETSYTTYQVNPLTMNTEPITKYQIGNSYVNGDTGTINCSATSATGSWAVVIQAQKTNGKWVITSVSAAG